MADWRFQLSVESLLHLIGVLLLIPLALGVAIATGIGFFISFMVCVITRRRSL